MVHRDQGMGLASAERRLYLEYRVPSMSLQAPVDNVQQVGQALGLIGLLEELRRDTVLVGTAVLENLPQISSKDVHGQPSG